MKKIAYLLTLGLIAFSCKGQKKEQKQPTESEKETTEVRQLSPFEKMEEESLKTEFIGIATSQGMDKDLFPITSTGVSTLPIKLAGEEFLKSLGPEQLEKTQFDIQDDEWRKWCNVDNGIYTRQGISLKEMDQEQRKLAFELMQNALSAKGLQLSKDIMKTDQTLRELNNGNPIYDEELYFFTIMGNPSLTEPWGWQIDGHHLVINYFILGDQVVMTPTFMGGEPIITTSGKYKGNTIFQDEQNLGLKFMRSLPVELQKEATLSTEKVDNDIRAEAFSDNVIVDFQGLPVSQMSEEQKVALLELANEYISNMREGHAKVKMEDIKKRIDETYFAWVGQTDENAVFYYRIHSPVVLIEFDHQGPIGIRGNGRQPTRNHIHTIVRTPNGNDYGKDYLRQHLEKHHH
ncbi:DUF3500 domain-containing protein [Ulvibacterium marinum]|uniref:DUF3500 domain-containing protein n=1 Tax=Ulvibacterium marinum TaxID=2419782 RepID=UPI002494E0CD|nr:DUF3500 domain-containing protein [Ulvibacterium marinum]